MAAPYYPPVKGLVPAGPPQAFLRPNVVYPPRADRQEDDDDNDDEGHNTLLLLLQQRKMQATNRYFQPQTTGAGFRYLQQQQQQQFSASIKAKKLLKRMLAEHSVEFKQHDDDDDDDDEHYENNNNDEPPKQLSKKPKVQTVNTTMSDETILRLARQVPSRMSLLASLLQVLHDDDGGTVSTRAFLKTCALSVRPGLTPAHMDAKEMVLAALHFLTTAHSVSTTTAATTTTTGPWMRPVQELGDLEKRVYEKVGNWTLEQILPAVVELEDVFYSSGEDLKFMPRTRFCPTHIPNKVEHDLLLLKGNPPVSTTKKVVRKKKTTATPSGSSGKVVKTEDDPVAQEATRIMSETTKGSNSPDEGELA